MTSHVMILPIVVVLLASSGRFKEAIKQAGSYNNEKESCPVRITISARGGFHQLQLPAHRDVVKDVTAIIMLENDELAYSVSPIYGKPGIFIFDCIAKKTRRIVAPRHLDAAYPDGADYFELHALRNGQIEFYYAPNVDTTDFNTLRTPAHLYHMTVLGSGVRTVH